MAAHQLVIVDVVLAAGAGHVEPVAGGEALVVGVADAVYLPRAELRHQRLRRRQERLQRLGRSRFFGGLQLLEMRYQEVGVEEDFFIGVSFLKILVSRF